MPHRQIPERSRSNARSLRRAITDAERRIWNRLRAHRFDGAAFRRQVPVGPYIADFLCFDSRLVIELDGGQHSESVRDSRRDAWFRSQGFAFLRFWNNDVFENLDGVLETIAQSLTTPPSLTLPRKDGGNRSCRGKR